ncbi:MAG: EamA family transporter [Proteobacteria bacterium]|nr:EamA family transporter [Pseudomonadota bacterium]
MPPMNPKLSAALATAIWGTTYIFVSVLLPHNPIFTAAVRALGGGLPLLLLHHQTPAREWWGKVALLGTLNCGVVFAFLFIAAERLPGGVAGTLQSLGPIITVLIAWPLLGERPTWLRLVSVVLGSIGVMILLTGGKIVLDAVGAVAGLTAAISLALGGVLLNRWGRPIPLLEFTAWQLVIGGVELAALAAIIGDVPTSITTGNVIAYVYVALIGTSIAYALWFHGVEKAGAASVAPFFLLIPMVAFALDAVIRGFVPTPVQSLGAAIVIGSLIVNQRAGRTRPNLAR